MRSSTGSSAASTTVVLDRHCLLGKRPQSQLAVTSLNVGQLAAGRTHDRLISDYPYLESEKSVYWKVGWVINRGAYPVGVLAIVSCVADSLAYCFSDGRLRRCGFRGVG